MLMVGLVLSLVLHASVLLPALVAVLTSDLTARPTLRADFDADDFHRLDAEPDSVDLGIEESKTSTMTWIGFDEYKKHMAALAEVEQAAFQTTPTGSEASAASPSEPPPPAPDTPDPQDNPSTSPDPFDELEAWFDAEEGEGLLAGEPTSPDARSQAIEDIIERLERMMGNAVETERPTRHEPAPLEPAPPEPAPVQPQPAGQPGVQSDQESDATSTVEVTMEQLTLGRPLAAHGLQIKPRKPVFTTLTLLTAVPANPTAELRFRRDGKPARVRLLESSGDSRIDEAVLNSLYRWRAAGKKLRELKGDETIPVKIRIILGRR